MTPMGIVWKSLRDGEDSLRYMARSRATTPTVSFVLSQMLEQIIQLAESMLASISKVQTKQQVRGYESAR